METRQLLIKNDIKASTQRITIYNYLKNSKYHPTASTIYNDLISEIPSLSKTTVYNTLKLFVEKSLVNEIIIEGNEARYDAIRNTHGHFKCIKCSRIFDFFFDFEKLNISSIKKYSIKTIQFYLKGLCEECKKFDNE